MTETLAYTPQSMPGGTLANLCRELFDFNTSILTSYKEDGERCGFQTELLEWQIGEDDVLLFDMDGTLIDTDACNTKAYKAAIEVVLGCGYAELFDVTRIERRVLKERLSWVSEEQLSRIVALKEAYYTQLIDEISIIPSTMAILERFRATNKIVLVTNARRQRTIQTLRHLGLEGKFDGIITKDDCGCVDKFTTALERFDLNPQNVWVFENEEVQAMAAVAAGININHIILG